MPLGAMAMPMSGPGMMPVRPRRPMMAMPAPMGTPAQAPLPVSALTAWPNTEPDPRIDAPLVRVPMPLAPQPGLDEFAAQAVAQADAETQNADLPIAYPRADGIDPDRPRTLGEVMRMGGVPRVDNAVGSFRGSLGAMMQRPRIGLRGTDRHGMV